MTLMTGQPNPAPTASQKKLRILIVEDHGPTRIAMSRLIRQAGAEVTTARDGEEGLESAGAAGDEADQEHWQGKDARHGAIMCHAVGCAARWSEAKPGG